MGVLSSLGGWTCMSKVTCSRHCVHGTLSLPLPDVALHIWASHLPHQSLAALQPKCPFWVLGAQGRVFISWVSPPRDKSSYHVGGISVCVQLSPMCLLSAKESGGEGRALSSCWWLECSCSPKAFLCCANAGDKKKNHQKTPNKPREFCPLFSLLSL